jgi:hypothetical protein
VRAIQEFSFKSCVIPVLFVDLHQNRIDLSIVISDTWSIGFSNINQKHRPQLSLHSYQWTALVNNGSHSQIDLLDSSLSINECS